MTIGAHIEVARNGVYVNIRLWFTNIISFILKIVWSTLITSNDFGGNFFHFNWKLFPKLSNVWDSQIWSYVNAIRFREKRLKIFESFWIEENFFSILNDYLLFLHIRLTSKICIKFKSLIKFQFNTCSENISYFMQTNE